MAQSNKFTYCPIQLTSKFNSMEILLLIIHWSLLKADFRTSDPQPQRTSPLGCEWSSFLVLASTLPHLSQLRTYSRDF